jgi:hypothetical protein
MDNTTSQPVPSVQQPASAGQPVRQPVPAAPIQPVGTRTKEAPLPAGLTNEWVSSSTPEVVLPKEVQEAGVEIQPVVPQVTQSAQQAGVTHAKEATPVESVKVEPLGMQTPRSVLNQLKAVHKSVKDSFSWLVRLVIKEQDKKEKGERLV